MLRKGYTTGTCAAAGAKAAAHALLGGKALSSVEVTLPSGSSLTIPVKSVKVSDGAARAVVIKDAGDDPDVTNGAEFVAEVRVAGQNAVKPSVAIRGGEGVGVVTRPGLKVAPGRPAINPVPLKMIRAALLEAARAHGSRAALVVTISVPKGRELAERTMNARLGIMGGISILGTSGIVEPMSLAAYTHSISLGVDVALASGLTEVVFSTGRSSEKVAERELPLPEVAFVLTGDHMGHALRDAAGRKGLELITVAGQFGKFTKLAAGHFETHCSDSSVEFAFLGGLCARFSASDAIVKKVLSANTAREVYLLLKEKGPREVITEVTRLVRENSERIAGKKVRAVLVGYENDLASSAG
ncbi:cobalt-precorrin-5B (C1)-methyltransferase [uncultured bacterium]|nr:cobalt-precorrin-5B (C1)-methyltransferase [uncultured bacterium]